MSRIKKNKHDCDRVQYMYYCLKCVTGKLWNKKFGIKLRS